jgi:hypothetical protein
MDARSDPIAQYRNAFYFWAFLLLGYIPVCLAVSLAFARWFGTYLPGLVFAAAWVLAFVALGARLVYWRCSDCGQRYGLVYPLPDTCPTCDIMRRQQRAA